MGYRRLTILVAIAVVMVEVMSHGNVARAPTSPDRAAVTSLVVTTRSFLADDLQDFTLVTVSMGQGWPDNTL